MTKLPWEYDSESGFITENERDMIICQFFSKSESPFFNCDANAEYIVKTANLFPKLVEALGKIINSYEYDQRSLTEETEEAKELLTKAKL